MKVGVFLFLTLGLCRCASLVVKPQIIYEDGALYRKIQTHKRTLASKTHPKIGEINVLLNDYDTYTTKAHCAITQNNTRAWG